MAIVMADLRSEASAEAGRAARVRTLLRKDEAHELALLEGGGVWLARVRRTEARRALAGRFVLVWRVAIDDAAGRPLASMLLPVAVDVARPLRVRRTRATLDALVAGLERATQPLVEQAAAEWQQAANRIVGQLRSTRLAREHDIASRMPTASAGHAYQPGLFDRRAERARQSDATFAATLEQAVAERLLAVERLVPADPCPPRLLLVLVP